MGEYEEFLRAKIQDGEDTGPPMVFCPTQAFGFQQELIEWSLRKARAAIFADCGLGKSLMQLTWAENIVRHTNRRVLVLTPLAVSHQTIREGEKFGVACKRSSDGSLQSDIVVTNYQRLERFNPEDFAGVVLDESSILKSFDGSTRKALTEFMRKVPYRLLCTATAAPNDFTELGTSSEALGYMGHVDMLTKFFKNDGQSLKAKRSIQSREYETKWRFKGHAEGPFWRWVCSWARAVRKPSDLGYDDGGFSLPPMVERHHTVESKARDGWLFKLPAVGLAEEREERKATITQRCQKVADLVDTESPALVWCHLNAEGELLEEMIPGAVQVAGSDPDEAKEERFLAFQSGESRVLITKPKIGAWGMNFQHCAHVTFFPSHSYEQYYQGTRRCWRFGQRREVVVDIVASDGERDVSGNLERKSEQASRMFSELVGHMRNELSLTRVSNGKTEEVPSWL